MGWETESFGGGGCKISWFSGRLEMEVAVFGDGGLGGRLEMFTSVKRRGWWFGRELLEAKLQCGFDRQPFHKLSLSDIQKPIPDSTVNQDDNPEKE
ncbi:hypothetical protein L6452_38185 [Arctium lappa]|uniref:Uncharacterized protein n=1 Tax=Arctium lappa TaxID=4217 RepID=A0ACB8Y4E0_ARCLA|nr:hypothetical protein L6452_38185 [Arctium lappa]